MKIIVANVEDMREDLTEFNTGIFVTSTCACARAETGGVAV